VAIGIEEGLTHDSWIMCDNLVSLRKADLTQFIGTSSDRQSRRVEQGSEDGA
jgi:mRNA-degrading endonuclease toxin of MazEF toxin-antitoxin module